jgi:hypothetical protein
MNPLIIHHQITYLIDALKYAANQFVKANRIYFYFIFCFLKKNFFCFLVNFDTPSTFAVSIYSLFYLLYILYPNNLRRELQPETIQSINSNEKPTNRLGIERVLLVSYLYLIFYFKNP